MEYVENIVIGAGLAGLTVARALVDSGKPVALLEKSAAPGGRLSTRRSEAGAFDHGAQYLTSRTPDFTALLNRLAEDGDLASWKPRGRDSARPWWVGRPGMSRIGEVLARGLDVKLGTRVTRVERQDGRYVVAAENADGSEFLLAAGRLVAAIPAPQAHALLAPLDPAFSALQSVRMAPCIAAMLAFRAPLGDDMPDLIRGRAGDAAALIVRNGSKPDRAGETFVLHSAPDWSRSRIDSADETVIAELIAAMRAQTGFGSDLPQPVWADLKRWLYALVEMPLDRPFLGDADDTLFACGDWCIEARAEAAHQSGLALARHIIAL